jgi:hypothetical protein
VIQPRKKILKNTQNYTDKKKYILPRIVINVLNVINTFIQFRRPSLAELTLKFFKEIEGFRFSVRAYSKKNIKICFEYEVDKYLKQFIYLCLAVLFLCPHTSSAAHENL